MLLWTRYVPADRGPVTVRAEVSETEQFRQIAAGGSQITGPWRDHTVKLDVTGLRPGHRYFYRFIAPDGSISPVGRMQTLPEEADRIAFAVFSCSNLPTGYFNAYAHAAASRDLAFAVHLGDYLYEYKQGQYAPKTGAVGGDWPLPASELFHLADYRLRYSSYRSDPDLQALHMAMPMILSWDDHESANGSWEGGAGGHQSGEGDWVARKAAAIQAYREWLPVSDEPWKAYDLADLATLYRTETRVLGRSQPPTLDPYLTAEDPAAALRGFRDGAWWDPARTMLGSTQEAWLAAEMGRSTREGRWQIVGSGTVMGLNMIPAEANDWLSPDAGEGSRGYVARAVLAAQVGLPNSMENWGGYPAARARLLGHAQSIGADLVVLSGDSHNAWAYELANDKRPAGVEFGGHSVSSPGMEEAYAASPERVARGLVAANSELSWCDTSRRGYMRVSVDRASASCDWMFCATVTQRDARLTAGHTARVLRGRRRFAD